MGLDYGDFLAAGIYGPLVELLADAGELLEHQVGYAAADYDYVWLEEVEHVA